MLAFFAIGLFFFSTFQLLLRAFYSMQDTRTPALINIGALAVNVGANLLFVFGFDLGVEGLALGHATSYLFSATLAFLVLRGRLGGIEWRSVGPSLLRTLVAAGLTGLAAWGRAARRRLARDRDHRRPVRAGVRRGRVGLAVFLLSALIFRIEEVDTVKRQLLSRRRG